MEKNSWPFCKAQQEVKPDKIRCTRGGYLEQGGGRFHAVDVILARPYKLSKKVGCWLQFSSKCLEYSETFLFSIAYFHSLCLQNNNWQLWCRKIHFWSAWRLCCECTWKIDKWQWWGWCSTYSAVYSTQEKSCWCTRYGIGNWKLIKKPWGIIHVHDQINILFLFVYRRWQQQFGRGSEEANQEVPCHWQ